MLCADDSSGIPCSFPSSHQNVPYRRKNATKWMSENAKSAPTWYSAERIHDTPVRKSHSPGRKIDGARAAGIHQSVKFKASSRPIGIELRGRIPSAVMRAAWSVEESARIVATAKIQRQRGTDDSCFIVRCRRQRDNSPTKQWPLRA